jgi:hypothetical protein
VAILLIGKIVNEVSSSEPVGEIIAADVIAASPAAVLDDTEKLSEKLEKPICVTAEGRDEDDVNS